jgi:hypothetical protein
MRSCLSAVYLQTVSVAQTVQHGITGWLINAKLESVSKEAILTKCKVLPGVFLEGLSKTKKKKSG